MYCTYTTPEITYSRLYAAMLSDSHLLIAGATGSGKSTVVNGIIHAALRNSPAEVGFLLIDPKRCELRAYKDLPHTIAYADRPAQFVPTLQAALNICEARFADMQRKGKREYEGSDIYVIIDELMFMMTTQKREVLPLLQQIAMIGRAAHVHLIACTQSPVAAVIPTPLKCNFDSRLALRTATPQDSRNIIGVKGCEALPDPKREGKAFGYYRQGAETTLYNLPKVEEAELNRIIAHWMNPKNTRKHFFGSARKTA